MPQLFLIMALWCAGTASSQAFDPFRDDPPVDARFPAAVEEFSVGPVGERMAGLIYLANGEGPHPTLVLLHGLPGNERNLDLGQLLRRAGFNVVFFSYRGAWGSEGRYSLLQVDDDALAVLAYLREPGNARRYRVDPAKLSVLGHSLGGFAALATGRQDKGLVCVGAMAPANLAVMGAGIKAGDPAMLGFKTYAEGLFMLSGFDGEALQSQLASADPADLDTAGFGAGLRGKSVFLVVGEGDQVTPAALMFDPVVAAYRRDSAIRLRYHTLPGGHSFSISRMRLSQLVLDWVEAECR